MEEEKMSHSTDREKHEIKDQISASDKPEVL